MEMPSQGWRACPQSRFASDHGCWGPCWTDSQSYLYYQHIKTSLIVQRSTASGCHRASRAVVATTCMENVRRTHPAPTHTHTAALTTPLLFTLFLIPPTSPRPPRSIGSFASLLICALIPQITMDSTVTSPSLGVGLESTGPVTDVRP